LGDPFGPIATDPLVDANSITGPSAEQLVDGRAEVFALDVPECLIDPGDSGHQDRTAAVEPAAVHRLPVVLDAEWVFPEEVAVKQFLNGRPDGPRTALDDGFAPADEPVTGFQPEEQPSRRHRVQFVVDYSHSVNTLCDTISHLTTATNGKLSLKHFRFSTGIT
jgi:hypothetical protein